MASSGKKEGSFGLALGLLGSSTINIWPPMSYLVMAIGAFFLLVAARTWHKERKAIGLRVIEPSHLIMIGLVGVAFFSAIAAGGYIWQQFFSSAAPALLHTSEPFTPQPTKPILGTATFDQASLTPALKDEFYRAIHGVDNLGVNFSRKISVVAEEGSAPYARALVNLFIAASWMPEDHGGSGEYVGTPTGYRLLPGVTISAPVPSGAAEAVRIAFERIGISTQRKIDRSRTDDYLIVEIGPAR